MRFGNSEQQQTVDEIPMAPLIDIVFLTLIFFMVTTVYATIESEVDITLPTASSSAPIDRSQGEIFINLRDDGQIIINEREVSIEELQGILDRVATFFPGGSVIIRGDAKAALGRAIDILDACKNADIQNVSFAALPEETPEAP